MKDIGLRDSILMSLWYNNSIIHNIFLTILYLLTGIFLLKLMSSLYKRILYKRILGSNDTQTIAKARFPRISAIFWIIIFPWMLFLFISFIDAQPDDISAFNKVFLYEINGKPVVTVIVDNLVGGTDGTVGTSYYRIQGIELETGKLFFDKKLKGRNSSSEIKVLGSSKDNLFLFFGGQIKVIDKVNGKTVRSVNSIPGSSNISLMDSDKMYKFDAAAQSILFEANDGLAYSMDINSFNITEKPAIDIGEYFKDEDPIYSHENGIQVIKASENGDYYMFLTDSDLKDLELGSDIPSSTENTERRFLYKGNLDNLKGLKKITKDVFLEGGFFLNKVIDGEFIYNNFDNKDKNYKNYENIICRGEIKWAEPFRVKDSTLNFIVHKKNLDIRADVMLTAFDLKDASIPWVLDTGAYGISECYEVGKDHILLLCKSAGGSLGRDFDTNFILYVSIKDGKYKGYDFRYGRSF